MENRLRLLAHWHARRREVDELLAPLLSHGPAAVDRVSARIADLREALEAEQLAFAAFAATVDLHHTETGTQTGTGPGTDTGAAPTPVDELALARGRADRARAAATALHPSVVEALAELDLREGELHLLDAPRPRASQDPPTEG